MIFGRDTTAQPYAVPGGKPMTGPGAVFREIHRIRCHAKDLANKIEQAPRALKAQQAQLNKQEEKLTQFHENLKQLKVRIHEKEVSIRAIQTTIKKHEKQRDEAGNKKEYDALQLEIKQEKQNITTLEDEILNAMGEVEEKTAQVPALEKAVQQARDDFAKYQKDGAERLARFAAERDRALAELAQVETGLSDEVLPYYTREVKGRGEDALASADARTCSACYTEITAQQFNDLRGSAFVKCKSCGRILYLTQ
jgi:uncharacterized protein